MAAEGVRLTQFNTPMPFCAPTRASLLTGRYPFRNGLTTNPAPDGGAAGRHRRTGAGRADAGPGLPAGGLCHRHGGQVAPRAQAARAFSDPSRLRRIPGHPLQQRHAAGPASPGRPGDRIPGRAGDLDPAVYRAGAAIPDREPRPAVLLLLRPRDAAQAAGLLRSLLQEERRGPLRRRPGRARLERGARARDAQGTGSGRAHPGALHQRQRGVVRGKHRRPAGHEGDDLGRRLPRSHDRPLARPAPRGQGDRCAGRDAGPVRDRPGRGWHRLAHATA